MGISATVGNPTTESTAKGGGVLGSNRLRTILLYTSAAIAGGAGWSGLPTLNYLALLYPFVYLYSKKRADSLSAVFYYAAATWSVIPGSRSFFHTGDDPLFPLLIWTSLIALCAAPWIAFYNRRFLPISALASLIALSFPPLGLVTVAHPLNCAGHWFPGTRWFGFCLPVALMVFYRRVPPYITAAILIATSLITHIKFQRPVPRPHILAVNTRFGGPTTQDSFGADLQTDEQALQVIALAHPETLLLFPESVVPGWSSIHEQRWATTFARLKKQHSGILLGTTIPIPNTEANRNVLLSRGYSERLSYVQRVPVPLGMWHFGNATEGFPAMLGYPATIRIWNRRAGVLICYEQLLVWTALQTLSRDPDMLLAASNLYWASGTPIPAIQHVSAQDWADLWAIPLYEATNR
jgi:hypothetical protein